MMKDMADNAQPETATMEHLGSQTKTGAASTTSRHLSKRQRLPNRRPAVTETLVVEGQYVEVTVGFAPESGAVREVFLVAGKEGSMLDSLLADAAVAISVALQHGVSPASLAKSVGRLPNGSIAPVDLDRPQSGRRPASLIGAALDLVQSLDSGEVREP